MCRGPVATASQLCPQLTALPETHPLPRHRALSSAPPPPPHCWLALWAGGGGGEGRKGAFCGAPPDPAAWPAARLSQTPGATGPARKALRRLWAPPLCVQPPGEVPASPGCPLAAPAARPFLRACGGQGSRTALSRLCLSIGLSLTAWLLRGAGLPPAFPPSSQASLVPTLAGLLLPFQGKSESPHFRPASGGHGSVGGRTKGWACRRAPAPNPPAWRPAHLAQPISSVP